MFGSYNEAIEIVWKLIRESHSPYQVDAYQRVLIALTDASAKEQRKYEADMQAQEEARFEYWSQMEQEAREV